YVRPRVHFDAVNNRQEILLVQAETGDRLGETFETGRNAACVEAVNILPPDRKQGEAFRPRPVLVGNVVDVTAERINVEHRLSFLAAEDANGEIKRTTACAFRSR